MARRKQVNPVQRAPSGDVMLQPADIPDRDTKSGDDYAKTVANGKPLTESHASADHPGLTQLAICVLGIYASLYVFHRQRRTLTDSV